MSRRKVHKPWRIISYHLAFTFLRRLAFLQPSSRKQTKETYIFFLHISNSLFQFKHIRTYLPVLTLGNIFLPFFSVAFLAFSTNSLHKTQNADKYTNIPFLFRIPYQPNPISHTHTPFYPSYLRYLRI